MIHDNGDADVACDAVPCGNVSSTLERGSSRCHVRAWPRSASKTAIAC